MPTEKNLMNSDKDIWIILAEMSTKLEMIHKAFLEDRDILSKKIGRLENLYDAEHRRLDILDHGTEMRFKDVDIEFKKLRWIFTGSAGTISFIATVFGIFWYFFK